MILDQTPSTEDAKLWANNVDVSGLLVVPYVGQIMLRLARNRITENWYKAAFPKGQDSSNHYRQTKDSFRSGADRTHRKTNKHGIMDCLPNGQFVDLPNAGHFPDIEMPSAFADTVKMVAGKA